MSFQIRHIVMFNIISVLCSVLKVSRQNAPLSHIRVRVRGSRRREDWVSEQARRAESALVMLQDKGHGLINLYIRINERDSFRSRLGRLKVQDGAATSVLPLKSPPAPSVYQHVGKWEGNWTHSEGAGKWGGPAS